MGILLDALVAGLRGRFRKSVLSANSHAVSGQNRRRFGPALFAQLHQF
jgi:hypothetical protein